MTLVDDGFHAKAYKIIETIGGAVFGKPVFAHSPTETRKRDVQTATRQLAAQTTALVAQSLVLVAATEALMTEHTVLQQSHHALAGAARSVSRQVVRRTIKGATRSIATMVGKAVPFLGVSLIWAVTALDVMDACENLKDLNGLAAAAGDDTIANETTVCGLRAPTTD